ncbi:MAG: hypothetical protein R2910_01835 [Gemmatimonadales bacterium]
MTTSFRRSHAAFLLLIGALACSSGGSGTAVEAPAPAVAPAEVPPVMVEPAPAPSFEGVATGNGWVDGSATAETSTRYFREVSGTRGQVFELKGDALGDEKNKACGTDWRASMARSVVLVTPDAGKGTVGFTLNATATAQRGFWRTKATLSCTTLNRTDAQAATMARGQAWISLGGGAADRDQLVIETAGSTSGEWALSVTDTAGQKYATDQVGSTLVAAVPGAGAYSVAASVTARAATAGGKDSWSSGCVRRSRSAACATPWHPPSALRPCRTSTFHSRWTCPPRCLPIRSGPRSPGTSPARRSQAVVGR